MINTPARAGAVPAPAGDGSPVGHAHRIRRPAQSRTAWRRRAADRSRVPGRRPERYLVLATTSSMAMASPTLLQRADARANRAPPCSATGSATWNATAWPSSMARAGGGWPGENRRRRSPTTPSQAPACILRRPRQRFRGGQSPRRAGAEITDLNRCYPRGRRAAPGEDGARLRVARHQRNAPNRWSEASSFIETIEAAGPAGQLPEDRHFKRLDRLTSCVSWSAPGERLRAVPARPAGTGARRMKVIDTGPPGCVVIEPAVFGDERGYFTRLECGALPARLACPPRSRSMLQRLALAAWRAARGLQPPPWPGPGQGGGAGLVSVSGGGSDVVGLTSRPGIADLRPPRGGAILSAGNKRHFWIPELLLGATVSGAGARWCSNRNHRPYDRDKHDNSR